MKKIFYAALFLVILGSCSKNGDDPVAPAETYLTLTAASSTWNYEVTDIQAGGTVSSYSVVSEDHDTPMFSTNYRAFVNSNSSIDYYNITDSKYRVYRAFPAILGGITKLMIYLDTQSSSWDQNYGVVVNGNTQTLNIHDSIIEKNSTRIVNGATYNNVICVKAVYSYPTISPDFFKGYTKSYYAPNYGLIEDSTNFARQAITGTTYLNTATKLTSAVLH